MIRHVVLLTFVDDASPEDSASVVSELRHLPHVIPEIRSYRVGADLGLDEGNADVVVVAEFDDEAGWCTYTDHPEHQRVITERIRPILRSRVAVQHEL